MGWKEKAKGFLVPKLEEHEVNGQKQNFYPLSTRILFRLRGLTGPLAAALGTLFESGDRDQGTIHREFDSSESADSEGRAYESQVLPISAELAILRTEAREKSIRQLVDAVTDTKNKIIIGLIVCDSMRDVFDRDMDDDSVSSFVDDPDLTMDILVEMLTGVAKANKKVFGPLGGKVSAALGNATEAALAKARDQVEEMNKGPEDSTEEEN